MTPNLPIRGRADGCVPLSSLFIQGMKMAEQMNQREVVTVEELLRACLYEQEALRRLLVRKGLLTDQEILDELKTVRRELETRRGR